MEQQEHTLVGVSNIAVADGRPVLNEATVHVVNPYHKVSS